MHRSLILQKLMFQKVRPPRLNLPPPLCAGERPPSTTEQWQAEFERYCASPEFRKVHSSMTLEEFKFIFRMEYAHRWVKYSHQHSSTYRPGFLTPY